MISLPQGFIDEISSHEILAGLSSSLLTESETSIRINPAKLHDFKSPSSDRVPWCDTGYYLDRRPQFTFDPALHQGLYYVQDASSMALDAVLRSIAHTPVRYLDACAAPGGKTTTALSALPAGSIVVANEFDFRRAEILAENLAKWGAPNVVVSRGDTAKLSRLERAFDIVAVDAPCSGEGMMRKDAQAVSQWSPALIRNCAELQREILSNVWTALRPGGYLIYSTCTFNTLENEDNLRYIIETLGAEPVSIEALEQIPSVAKGIATPYPCYRFIPGRVRGEGLFLAVVKKHSVGSVADIKLKPSQRTALPADISSWFDTDVEFMSIGNDIYALPKANAATLRGLASKLDAIMMGIPAASVKGRDVIPMHQLALSTAFRRDAFSVADVGYVDAIRYLQRENITVDAPKGFVLLTYKGYPLGIVKNLGNRTNSTLPKPWRILSQNIPASAPEIII